MTKNVSEDTVFRVMRELERTPDLSQRGLSIKLGVSLGCVNYCLKALSEKGLVKIRNFRASDQKRKYAYVLTPKGLAQKAGLTARFLERKTREYEALKAEIETLHREIAQEGGS
ncbi:MarR family EPS-associated transcriptional regulator [Tateyamaria pelophila]|uniref:MarR family EPS-associated transcriptional regulator n=1 Tax=Tateyamaria pelophila TaxID=328415 RepID=UPI001CBE6F4C|nr:MarR family EPS-associated transcriptional regulator [Tateyamaria pelophila]